MLVGKRYEAVKYPWHKEPNKYCTSISVRLLSTLLCKFHYFLWLPLERLKRSNFLSARNRFGSTTYFLYRKCNKSNLLMLCFTNLCIHKYKLLSFFVKLWSRHRLQSADDNIKGLLRHLISPPIIVCSFFFLLGYLPKYEMLKCMY